MKHWTLCAIVGACLVLSGCITKKQTNLPLNQPSSVLLTDVTASSGISWSHNAGRSRHKYLPETVGGGGGFIDYDNDGDIDILLIDSGSLVDIQNNHPNNRLFQNNGHGKFTDVTRESGIAAVSGIYGIGATLGDFNNDGWMDILLTGVGHTILLENRKGTFIDVTRARGAAVDGFTTAAVFLDANHDGKTDIFIARYVEWSPESDLPCGPSGKPQYCAPYQYKAAHPELLLQQTDGHFTKANTMTWGIGNNPGKTLSIVPYDFDKDGQLDYFLANDTEPDVLLMAGQNGLFRDMAIEAGVAVGVNGSPTGSMGADIFGDGKSDILGIGVFAGQQLSLFDAPSAQGLQLFSNVQQVTGVAAATLMSTTFGLVFGDLNLDSEQDIVLANGHIDDDGMSVGSGQITYRQPLQVLLKRSGREYQSWLPKIDGLQQIVGRGLASGDIDDDGKVDLLVFENNGPVRLIHNDSAHQGPWLGLSFKSKLLGGDAQGAMVTLRAGKWMLRRCVTPVRSYLSLCDTRMLVSLPNGTMNVTVDITWPGGQKTSQRVTALNRYVCITQR